MLPDVITDHIQSKFNNRLPEGFLGELQTHAQLVTLKKGDILISDRSKHNKTYAIVSGSLVRF